MAESTTSRLSIAAFRVCYHADTIKGHAFISKVQLLNAPEIIHKLVTSYLGPLMKPFMPIKPMRGLPTCSCCVLVKANLSNFWGTIT